MGLFRIAGFRHPWDITINTIGESTGITDLSIENLCENDELGRWLY